MCLLPVRSLAGACISRHPCLPPFAHLSRCQGGEKASHGAHVALTVPGRVRDEVRARRDHFDPLEVGARHEDLHMARAEPSRLGTAPAREYWPLPPPRSPLTW